jgi:hypothetical protein
MTASVFRVVLIGLGAGFAVVLFAVCGPPFVRAPDLLGAFGAGFVNPFASGYALDAICCWLVLGTWIAHDAKVHGVKHGWVALVLGIVPGVATGFAVYLLLRHRQVVSTSPAAQG